MRIRSRGVGRQLLVVASGLAAWGMLTWIYVRRATPTLDAQPSAVMTELPAGTAISEAHLADSTHDRTVPFEPGRAVLTQTGRALLDDLVRQIQADSTAGVSVDGLAGLGGVKVAQSLLVEGRARAVVSYLVNHGIPASRLTSRDSTRSVTGADTVTARPHQFRVHPGDS
jgi:outer membrane protein OmpA-like peptidoglycan-associated protein